MTKHFYMPFFTEAYLADTQHLSLEEQGAYNPQHLAILTDYENALGMIHCYAQARRVVEHRLDDDWKNRLVKVFRWHQSS